MEPVHLFALASRRMEWLSVRQATVASNIANADTPGFKSKDVVAFEDALNGSGLGIKTTNSTHLSASASAVSNIETVLSETGVAKHSGNTVALDKELIKSGQVSGAHALTTGVLKSFHRMMMMSTRS